MKVSGIKECTAWLAENDCTVAKTDVGDVRVSTAFMGLDHEPGDGPPLVFETRVFGGRVDTQTVQYSTNDEAEAGHQRMVAKVTAAERVD